MKISVKVKPNAKEEKIEKISENNFLVWVKEKPVENKANQAAVKILAKYFGVAPLKINLLQGKTSRNKVFAVYF